MERGNISVTDHADNSIAPPGARYGGRPASKARSSITDSTKSATAGFCDWTIPDNRLYTDYTQHVADWHDSFGLTSTDDDMTLTAPYWACVPLLGTLDALLKPHPKLQYGFSNLLVLIDVVAFVLAATFAWARWLGRAHGQVDATTPGQIRVADDAEADALPHICQLTIQSV